MPNQTKHVRTRTGCWTCRFRKKKCDEGRPACEQCSHLKLVCDGYNEQPLWMTNEDMAKLKKDEIKSQMVRRSRRRKRSQILEDNQAKEMERNGIQFAARPSKPVSPPCSDEDSLQDHLHDVEEVTRSVSGMDFEYTEFASTSGSMETPLSSPSEQLNPILLTHSINSKPFLDRETTIPENTQPKFVSSTTILDAERISYIDEEEEQQDDDDPMGTTNNGVSLSLGAEHDEDNYMKTVRPMPSRATESFLGISFPESSPLDQKLAELYFGNVFGVTYRALSKQQVVKYHRALILPMFIKNKSFFHGCISSTALHFSNDLVSSNTSKQLMTEVYKHRTLSLNHLNQQMKKHSNYAEIAATICALVSFEVYSRSTNWRIHVKAASESVRLLDWPNKPPTDPGEWFIFSRVMWLDIISSLTDGKPPYFWEVYHRMLFLPQHLRGRYRLVEMTGCDDTVMYLLSEVICLEAWKNDTLRTGVTDDIITELRRRGEILETQLRDSVDVNNPPPHLVVSSGIEYTASKPKFEPMSPVWESSADAVSTSTTETMDIPHSYQKKTSFKRSYSVSDIPSPIEMDQLNLARGNYIGQAQKVIPDPQEDHEYFSSVVTAAFRTAARIYLASVVYGFDPNLPQVGFLLEELIMIISLIPSGPTGYDRSIVAPLLLGGSVAVIQQDRDFFLQRLRKTPRLAKYGNLGTVDNILLEVWSRVDNDYVDGDPTQQIPWRQVMIDNHWEYLLV